MCDCQGRAPHRFTTTGGMPSISADCDFAILQCTLLCLGSLPVLTVNISAWRGLDNLRVREEESQALAALSSTCPLPKELEIRASDWELGELTTNGQRLQAQAVLDHLAWRQRQSKRPKQFSVRKRPSPRSSTSVGHSVWGLSRSIGIQ